MANVGWVATHEHVHGILCLLIEAAALLLGVLNRRVDEALVGGLLGGGEDEGLGESEYRFDQSFAVLVDTATAFSELTGLVVAS